MAAAGLAICLAYLSLERFRYRRPIRKEAQEHIEKLEKLTTKGVIKSVLFRKADLPAHSPIEEERVERQWARDSRNCLRQILWAYRLEDNEDGVISFLIRAWQWFWHLVRSAEDERDNVKNLPCPNCKLRPDLRGTKPKGFTSLIYMLVFSRHVDRILCYFLSIIMALVIFSDSLGAGTIWETLLLSLSNNGKLIETYLVLAFFVPAFLVLCGHFVKRWGVRGVHSSYKPLSRYLIERERRIQRDRMAAERQLPQVDQDADDDQGNATAKPKPE